MILVSGGTGLVGSHLLFDLCKSGKSVRAMKRGNSNISNVKKVFLYYSENADELFKNIEWVEAELLDPYSLSEAMADVTQVYHCAAMVSFDSKKETEMMNINIEGTANMVNTALEAGVKKFVHVSSVASLGEVKEGEIATEETFWKASPENSNYAVSKYGAEREVWRASNEGLDVIIVNPSLIIGPGNWKQSSSDIFSKGYKGIKFYTDGGNGFVDVRDVSAIMIKLMESNIKNERFIISSENIKLKHLLDNIHQEFNRPKAKIKAGKFLIEFAWVAEKIRSMIMGGIPLITKETARISVKLTKYSNRKILSVFPDYRFIPLEKSVKDTCRLFLKEV